MSWATLEFFYSDHFHVQLQEGHRFPMEKYKLLRKELIEKGIVNENQFYASNPISQDFLSLAHDKNYVKDVLDLTLDRKSARKIGLPLSKEMINRARASAQAFTQAVESSISQGFSASLAGGTHHAHYNAGEGFCFFNDFAINTRLLGKKSPQRKILILDLDVHQGNGNSSILKKDRNVFIVSFHGKNNYPFKKISSHIDVGFEDGTEDHAYLTKLADTISQLRHLKFDNIFYQAGVDALAGDRFGKLSLSLQGLEERDRMVFEWAFKDRIPIASAIGGGYNQDIKQTLEANTNTFEVAKSLFGKIN